MKSCAPIHNQDKNQQVLRNYKRQVAIICVAFATVFLNCRLSIAQVEESVPTVPPKQNSKPAKNSSPPFPIGNKWSRSFQKYTGINLVTEVAAARIAAMCIKAKVGGHVKVSVHVYSFTDLLCGKVKSVAVKLSGSSYHGVPLGNVTLASTNPVWYHPFKSRKLQAGLQSPILVKLDGDINSDCVAMLINGNAPLIAKAGKLQLPGMGEQQLVFLNPKAAIEDGKVCIRSTVITAGSSPDTGVSLVVAGIPYLDGSKVMLKEMSVASPDISDSNTFSSFVEGVANPLFNLARLDRRDHAIRLDSLAIEGNSVKYGGNLLVAPRTTALATK